MAAATAASLVAPVPIAGIAPCLTWPSCHSVGDIGSGDGWQPGISAARIGAAARIESLDFGRVADGVRDEMMIAMLTTMQSAAAACTEICVKRLREFQGEVLAGVEPASECQETEARRLHEELLETTLRRTRELERDHAQVLFRAQELEREAEELAEKISNNDCADVHMPPLDVCNLPISSTHAQRFFMGDGSDSDACAETAGSCGLGPLYSPETSSPAFAALRLRRTSFTFSPRHSRQSSPRASMTPSSRVVVQPTSRSEGTSSSPKAERLSVKSLALLLEARNKPIEKRPFHAGAASAMSAATGTDKGLQTARLDENGAVVE
eukprot:TRINITY_DN49025_c0_g1_i1.p1 TRINITY_DN49025_c0_g1~~TRINITY_DN49025_c0_g1_i1.p1  ORF type:complete len:341 (-),score=58.82 TRINITY_DN49025_c0_g1_i1:198-1169(-)